MPLSAAWPVQGFRRLGIWLAIATPNSALAPLKLARADRGTAQIGAGQIRALKSAPPRDASSKLTPRRSAWRKSVMKQRAGEMLCDFLPEANDVGVGTAIISVVPRAIQQQDDALRHSSPTALRHARQNSINLARLCPPACNLRMLHLLRGCPAGSPSAHSERRRPLETRQVQGIARICSGAGQFWRGTCWSG